MALSPFATVSNREHFIVLTIVVLEGSDNFYCSELNMNLVRLWYGNHEGNAMMDAVVIIVYIITLV